jgi:FRG domain
METCKLGSWDAFEDKIVGLTGTAKATNSVPLFRGQTNAHWPLKTTLERYSTTRYSVRRYNDSLLRIQPSLASSGSQWQELEADLPENYTPHHPPPNYAFMCHVRERGFPSPLLDWSESPYIALYFAYRHAVLEGEVVIHVCQGETHDGDTNIGSTPEPLLTVHGGHFMRQCRYTLAVKKINSEWFYCPQEAALARKSDSNRGYTLRITMPGYLKFDVMKRLHNLDINAYSLYGTEQSLMEKLAFTEIQLYNEAMMNT